MDDFTVSIIIITCDRPFLLGHCLERVLAQPYTHKEVIVVDSSSGIESQRVVEQYPSVLYVCLRGRRNNMPQARNTGLAYASGEVIAFIDDDAMVQPCWLEALVTVYRDETVGAAGGRVIAMPEPYCEQEKGAPHLSVMSSGRIIARNAGLNGSLCLEVDHLIGCNMSFRRQALIEVGGFDSSYTLTNLREETDLCVRVKNAGWRILFHPSIAVVHFSVRSLQPYFLERPSVQFSNGRNCMYFAIKHFGLNWRTLLGQLLDIGRSCGRAAYFASLFAVGIVAHIAGRIVGLSAGLLWRLDRRRRAAAAPPCVASIQPQRGRGSRPAAMTG